MVGKLSLTRRGVLKTVGATAVGTSQFTGSVGAIQHPGEYTERENRGIQATEGVTEDVTVRVNREAEKVRYTFEYRIPAETDEFEISLRWLSFPFRELTEIQQFERKVADSEPDRFVWEGADAPRLVLEDDLSAEGIEELGYRTETELFLPSVPASYPKGESTVNKETHYTLEEDGYVNEDLLFVGPHESEIRTVEGTELAMVVPDSVSLDADIQGTLDLMEQWNDLIGGLRLAHQSKACVLIRGDKMTNTGQAIGGSFYVSSYYWGLDSIDNVVAHEFAHTVFGTFGGGKMYWLKEAAAEYYGYLLALNTGLGDFEEFLDVRTTDGYETAILTDSEALVDSLADYSKGAHVLAALDAEIRDRSDGAQSLLSVFEMANTYRFNLGEYTWFRNAVNQTALSEDLAEWVDKYVDGTALPDIPDQREFYTFRGRGRPNEMANYSIYVEQGGPFEFDIEIEPLRPNDGTVPLEIYLGSERVLKQTVEIGDQESKTVTVTDADFPKLTSPSYDLLVRVGGNEIAADLSVAIPPEFRIFELTPKRAELLATDPLSVEVDIRNTGNEAGTTTLELVLVTESNERTLDTREIEVEALDTKELFVEDLDISDVDPGEYTLVARVGDHEDEQSLVIQEPTGNSGNSTQAPENTGTGTETDDDASGPGFGIGSTVTGLGGLAYVLKRRLGPETEDDE